LPLDFQSVALGMIVGSFGIILLGGSSLAQSFCNPVPVDRAEKNRQNEVAKAARMHGENEWL
jgi:hypothetical protein